MQQEKACMRKAGRCRERAWHLVKIIVCIDLRVMFPTNVGLIVVMCYDLRMTHLDFHSFCREAVFFFTFQHVKGMC